MGYLSLACAAAGLLVLLVAGIGKYLAVGLGILALGAGLTGYRRGRPRMRLSGAAGTVLGILALVLGMAKIALTLVALDQLERLLAP